MRVAHALWLVGLSLLGSGCALIEDGSRNFCYGVSSAFETHREKKRNREWAEIAWQTACLSTESGPRTADYAQGFKDGYAEYLFRGGDGEPPAMAPLHYRHLRYQNEKGYQAIEDWFAGYRHGTATARDTGARRWITGPSGLQSEFREVVAQDPITRTPSARPSERVEIASPPQPKITVAPHVSIPPPVNFETPRVEQVLTFPSITVEVPTAPEPLRVRMDAVLPGPVQRSAPVVEPPARAKITRVNEAPLPAERANITRVNEAPLPAERANITRVNEAPLPVERARITNISEAPSEPARARIKAITVAPEREP